MELTVLVGNDDRLLSRHRSELLSRAADGAAERVDVADDGGRRLVEAISVPSLFGGHRVVDVRNFAAIDDESFAAFIDAAPDSDATLVVSTATLPASVKKRLPSCDVIECKLPYGSREVTARIRQEAQLAGITLDAAQIRLLASRTVDDVVRAYQVIDTCVTAGLLSPTFRQLEVLLGTAAASVRPWDLFTMLRTGDLPGALAASEGLDASDMFAFVGWLRPRVLGAARCAALGLGSAQDVAAHVPGAAARDALSFATSFGERLGDAVAAVGTLEHRLRSATDVPVAFDAALINLHRLLHPQP